MDEKFRLRCAVYVIFIKFDEVLLFRRVNTGWQDGLFGLPGGHLEEGETVLEAAKREAMEESGLELNTDDLQLVHVVHRKSNFDYIDLFFTTTKWAGEAKITEENKSDKMLWADINNLPENTSDYMREAIKNINGGVFYSQFGWKI